MKTNAAAAASAACAARRRADDALSKSLASIIDAGGADRDEAIAESIEQYRQYLQKNLGDLAATERGDEGDPDDDEADELDGGDDDKPNKGANMNTEQTMAKFKRERIAKLESWDITDVAKAVVVHDADLMINESEFAELITKAAQKQHPELRPDAAFSKLYCEQSERGTLLRKACAAIKAMPLRVNLAPDQTHSPRAFHDAVSDTESSEAYKQLVELGRQKWPTASEAQQFARAMTDPANRVLASKAHKRPGPNDWNQFPR
jgi:hypothetical protein